MRKYNYFIFFPFVLTIVGCVSNGEQVYVEGKCVTCWNNPITGKSVNYDKKANDNRNQNNNEQKIYSASQSNESPGNKYCHKRIKYKKDIPLEIDIAYIRYKRTFGFMTKNEQIRARGLDPATASPLYTIMDNGFRHVVVPGVRYHMQESVDLDTGYYIGWLSLELEKAGREKTRVYVSYCESGIDGFEPKYSKTIRKKVEEGYL